MGAINAVKMISGKLGSALLVPVGIATLAAAVPTPTGEEACLTCSAGLDDCPYAFQHMAWSGGLLPPHQGGSPHGCITGTCSGHGHQIYWIFY